MQVFQRIMNRTCRIYTATALLMLFINVLAGVSPEATSIRVSAFLLILPFSVLIGLANEWMTLEKLSLVLRAVVHCIVCCGSFFTLLYLPVASSAGSTRLIIFLLILLIYWIGMALYLIFVRKTRQAKKKESAEKTAYKNLF